MLYDVLLQPDVLNPRARFIVQSNRLLNERLHVMVVGRGDSYLEYVATLTKASLVAAVLYDSASLVATLISAWTYTLSSSW